MNCNTYMKWESISAMRMNKVQPNINNMGGFYMQNTGENKLDRNSTYEKTPFILSEKNRQKNKHFRFQGCYSFWGKRQW